MSDSEKSSNRLQLDLILILVNFSYELGLIGGSFEKRVQNGATNLKVLYCSELGRKLFLPSKKQTW